MSKSKFYRWPHKADWITIPQRDSDPVDPKKMPERIIDTRNREITTPVYR